MRPLEGIVVLDFSQYLAGPSAALRLADLGARVIKIENPKTGDNSRSLTIKNMVADGDSVNFCAINRGKESFSVDMKDPAGLGQVKKLVGQADVMIENFRPGTMQKFGLDYERVKEWNPRIVYASITGYGENGPWRRKPGQDLLIQSMSGLTYLNGNGDMPPTPFAISIADTLTGIHATEGILSCLIRRGKTGAGGRVEVSLMESALFLQIEALTTYLNDGHQPPKRSFVNNAHAYVGAPYGIYETKDSCIAIAMGSVSELGRIIACPQLENYVEKERWVTERDEIKAILAQHLKKGTTEYWLEQLRRANYWASEVRNWEELTSSEAFRALDFTQEMQRSGQPKLYTTRCPIRIDGSLYFNAKGAPKLGADNAKVIADFGLNEGEN